MNNCTALTFNFGNDSDRGSNMERFKPVYVRTYLSNERPVSNRIV